MNKNIIKQQERELRDVLNEWDFLSVAAGGPQDEYDCMLGPLLTLLHKGANQTDVKGYIKKECAEHFGIEADPDGLEPTLKKIFIWWNKYK